MTWQAMVRLPEAVGTALDAMGKRLGVERAVAARIILMQWYEAQQGEQEMAERGKVQA